MSCCCGKSTTGERKPEQPGQRRKEWAESSLSIKHDKGETGGKAVDPPRVRTQKKPETSESENDYKLKWSSLDRWEVDFAKRIGEGGYGHVFLGKDKRTGDTIVAKRMKAIADPVKKAKADQLTRREVFMLQQVQKGPNIVRLLDNCKMADDTVVLIFEYIESPSYKETFKRFGVSRHGPSDAREYLYNLLRAIHYTHSKGIVHRDIKGGNTLYNPETRKLRLIDWGFADYYREDGYEQFPGTRYYKAPELFLKYRFYDFAVDMWSFGVVAASLLCQKMPLFAGEDDTPLAQMVAIGQVLGLNDYATFLARYETSIPDEQRELFAPEHLEDRGCPRVRVPFTHVGDTDRSKHLLNPNAVNFLSRVLQWDPHLRLTSSEALKHPYFGRLRQEMPLYPFPYNGLMMANQYGGQSQSSSSSSSGSGSSYSRSEPRHNGKGRSFAGRSKQSSAGSKRSTRRGSSARGERHSLNRGSLSRASKSRGKSRSEWLQVATGSESYSETG